MSRHQLLSHLPRTRSARPAVEAIEERIPVAESIGMGITLRALAGAAMVGDSQIPPPPPVSHINKGDDVAPGVMPRAIPHANGLTDTRFVPILNAVPVDAVFGDLVEPDFGNPTAPFRPNLAEPQSLSASTSEGGIGSSATGGARSMSEGSTSLANASGSASQAPEDTRGARSVSEGSTSLADASGFASQAPETNALAHGLVNAAVQAGSPLLSSPLRPPIRPLGPTAPGILATGPDAGMPPMVRVFDPKTLKLKLEFLAYVVRFRSAE